MATQLDPQHDWLKKSNNSVEDYLQKKEVLSQKLAKQEQGLKHDSAERASTLNKLCQSSIGLLDEEQQSAQRPIRLAQKKILEEMQAKTDARCVEITQRYAGLSEALHHDLAKAQLEATQEREADLDALKSDQKRMSFTFGEAMGFQKEALPLIKKFTTKKHVPYDFKEELYPDCHQNKAQLFEALKTHDVEPQFEQLQGIRMEMQEQVDYLRSSFFCRLYLKVNPVFPFVFFLILHIAAFWNFMSKAWEHEFFTLPNVLISFAATNAIVGIIALIGYLKTSKAGPALAQNAIELTGLLLFCPLANQAILQGTEERHERELEDLKRDLQKKLKSDIAELDVQHDVEADALRAEVEANSGEDDDRFNDELKAIKKEFSVEKEARRQELLLAQKAEQVALEEDLQSFGQKRAEEEAVLQEEWQKTWQTQQNEFKKIGDETQAYADEFYLSWEKLAKDWKAVQADFLPIANLELDMAEEITRSQELAPEDCTSLKQSGLFSMHLPENSSLCIASDGEEREKAINFLQNTILRIMSNITPGKAKFSFFDPLSLGDNFAAFMHLNDYKEELTGGRVLTTDRQIDKQLLELNDHMEIVIQKYLRNEFNNICDYNEEVGEIAEAFRFLVLADFPKGFNEDSLKRLASVAQSGARCGVFLLLHYDRRHKIPKGFHLEDLGRNCIVLDQQDDQLIWPKSPFKQNVVTYEKLPPMAEFNGLIRQIGEASLNAAAVEIPFHKVQYEGKWQGDSSKDLDIAIGLTGTRQQCLNFGHGTAQHALIAGKTGSGKSNLLHVIICNMAWKYSPEELQFYLIDFKKGVEFKAYANHSLPHAKAIAIESDRQFGLSVLRKIDIDLQERGEILREAGTQNIKEYRKNTGKKMARIMLIVDEFQEMFTEDDSIAQEASLLLDRIVRQGRAFGVHVLLGSQTLAGTYSIARSTMGQMAIRIALQCSESDSYVILNENNPAARMLTRPGEAIYNSQAGMPEANVPLQTAYMDDEEKTKLLEVLADPEADTFVFEGNVPAVVDRCQTMKDLTEDGKAHCVLGEPNAIQEAQALTLSPMGAQNVLMIGQKEENALAMTASSISSLSRSLSTEKAKFTVLDGSSADLPRATYFKDIADAIPQSLETSSPKELESKLNELYALLEKRIAGEEATVKHFVFVHGLHRFRKLKQEDSFSWDDEGKGAGAQFGELLTQGPEYNIHFVVWCDSWNNFSRLLARKLLNEFEYRILFQMSQSDSINIIDTPDASKLELHTALIFEDQTGDSVKFRPFALPQQSWWERLAIPKAV